MTTHLGHHARPIAAIFYCTIFGFLFFFTCMVYLVNLHEVLAEEFSATAESRDSPPQLTCDPLKRTEDDENSTFETFCKNFHTWESIANTGIVYGVICLVVGILRLWYLCWTTCCDHGNNDHSKMSPTGTGLANGRGKIFKTVTLNIVLGHQRLVSKSQMATSFWTSCFRHLYIALTYLFTLILWLTGIILPLYLAASLSTSEAFKATLVDPRLYFPALSIFTTSILSVGMVLLSVCVLVCMDIEIESEDKEKMAETTRSVGDKMASKGQVTRSVVTWTTEEGTTRQIYEALKSQSQSPTSTVASFV